MNRILHFLGFSSHNNKVVLDDTIESNTKKDTIESNTKNHVDRLKHFILVDMDMSNDNLLEQNITSLDILLLDYKHDDILDIITDFKNYPTYHLLYVLAICCSIRLDNDVLDYKKDFREDCFKLVVDICKTSFDLFNFVELYEGVNKKKYNSTGWNSGMKKMISKWYNSKTPYEIIHDIKKHDKWSHKDVIRLAHVKAANKNINILLRYLVKGPTVLREDELYMLECQLR